MRIETAFQVSRPAETLPAILADIDRLTDEDFAILQRATWQVEDDITDAAIMAQRTAQRAAYIVAEVPAEMFARCAVFNAWHDITGRMPWETRRTYPA